MVDDNGGEDFGNLNRKIPGIMFYPTLLPERKISNHTLAFYELLKRQKKSWRKCFRKKVVSEVQWQN